MNKIKLSVIAFSALILTGCPYPATFVYRGEPYESDGIRVRINDFFYDKIKDSVRCGISLSISNTSSDTREIFFGSSYLSTSVDTLRLRGTYHGNPIPRPPGEKLVVGPGVDTFCGLGFKGPVKIFKQEVQLHLVNSNIDTVIIYNRIRK